MVHEIYFIIEQKAKINEAIDYANFQDTIVVKDKYTGENFSWVKSNLPIGINQPDGIVYKKFDNGIIRVRIFKDVANVMWWGAIGDGKTNDANAINNAVKTCSLLKIKLMIKKTKKFYLINPTILAGDESTAMKNEIKVGIEMRSDMNIVSDKAIIKMADNISNINKPSQMRMFFSNDFLNNIHIDGLIIDMNGANNMTSINAPNIYTNTTQFHIGFSGTKNNIAAGANNVIIENCVLINGAGVTCIATAQSNTNNVKLGNNWIIKNNIFNNNGIDCNDHSSIYAWANNVQCFGNTFTNPKMFKNTGGLVAYEVHGSNHSFYKNKIENYYQGLWVSINYSQPLIENTKVYDNTFNVSCQFIDFYNGNLETTFYAINIINTYIENNTGYITDDVVKDQVKQFIRIGSRISPTKVYIKNNTVHSLSTKKPSALVSGIIFPNHKKTFDEIYINNNTSTGLSNGVIIYFNENQNVGKITITGNKFGKYKTIFGSNNADLNIYGSSKGNIKEVVTDIKQIYTDTPSRILKKSNF